MRTWPFFCQHGLAEKLRFLDDLQQSPGALGLLLGDHLVTMGVHIKLCGAMMLMDLMDDCLEVLGAFSPRGGLAEGNGILTFGKTLLSP